MRSVAVVLAACVSVALAGTVPNYDPPPTPDPYQPPSPSYGEPSTGYESQPYCRTVTTQVPKEHCEAYTNRICRTQQQESCRQVPGRNCRAVVASQTNRRCFNVTETRCNLKEETKFENVPVPIVVQKCSKQQERVCSTIHETDVAVKDEVKCINVEKEACSEQDQIVNDRTCRINIRFECSVGHAYPTPPPKEPYSPPSMMDVMGQSREPGYTRSKRDTYPQPDPYSQPEPQYDSSSVNSYGQPKVNCKRYPEKKCYDTPRTVTVQRCGKTVEEQCETLSVSSPFVKPKQTCHMEDKRVCRLEKSTSEKKVKKFVYTKQCRQVPRRVCENEQRKALVPSCVATSHAECSFSPVEQCENIPRQHCFQYTVPKHRKVCDEMEPTYPEPQPPTYSPSEPAPTPTPYNPPQPQPDDDY